MQNLNLNQIQPGQLPSIQIPISKPDLQVTTKYQLIQGKYGNSLFIYKDDFCITGYEDEKYQIFYTESCNAIFDKTLNKVFELSIDSWTKLMLNLETFFKP